MSDKKYKSLLGFVRAKPFIFAVGVLGLLLLLIGSFTGNCQGVENSGEEITEDYRITLTREAETLCRQVKGAGEVHIMLTLESGEANTYSGSHVTSTTPPRVLGVAVVAEGAGSDAVRAELTELLSALFRVGANRIHISPAK